MFAFPLYLSYTYLLICYAGVHLTSAAAGKNIFLLSGQSNMSGRGGVVNSTWDGYIPPESSPNPAILRLTANLTWEPAAEPLHRDIDIAKVCGVGPGMAFANYLLRKNPSIGVVGLVPCAIGGTNISQWVRGGDLYNQMMRRAAAAVAPFVGCCGIKGKVIRSLLKMPKRTRADCVVFSLMCVGIFICQFFR